MAQEHTEETDKHLHTKLHLFIIPRILQNTIGITAIESVSIPAFARRHGAWVSADQRIDV